MAKKVVIQASASPFVDSGGAGRGGKGEGEARKGGTAKGQGGQRPGRRRGPGWLWTEKKLKFYFLFRCKNLFLINRILDLLCKSVDPTCLRHNDPRILQRVLARVAVERCAIFPVQVCRGAVQRAGRVGRGHQQLDAEQHAADRERGRPLAVQRVKADVSRRRHVAVVDRRGEAHLGRLERVLGWKRDRQTEDAAGVRRVGRADDGGVPRVQVVGLGPAGDAVRGARCHIAQLFLNSIL